MNSAAGDARTPRPHAAATSAETPSDIETETRADFGENETGLFKAFERARPRKVLQTRRSRLPAQNHLTMRRSELTRYRFCGALSSPSCARRELRLHAQGWMSRAAQTTKAEASASSSSSSSSSATAR